MPVNYCSKCGQEFETKNPKRIVCPNCLYLDRTAAPSVAPVRRPEPPPQAYPQGGGGYGPPQQEPGGYGPPQQRPPGYGYQQQQPGAYGPPQQRPGGYGGGYGPPQQRPGGYGPPQQRPGGYGPPRPGGYGPPRPGGSGGFNRGGPPRGGPGGFNRGGPRPPAKKLLIPKEVLFEIEKQYKVLLPLPNPDAHAVIAQSLNIEPNKAFFGINLVRQKMRLPKLEYPKRPLAVSQDQLTAVKALYEPFLPLPPLGIHKILAKQLRMDEWRVHVAIGLIRKQMAMPRWNEDRDDLPPQMKEQIKAAQEAKALEQKAKEAENTAKQAAAAKTKKKEDAKAKQVPVEE
jgi:hypothetical protein